MDHRTLMDAELLLQQGIAASQINDSATAIDLFVQASAATPSAGLPQFLLASEYASLGQMDKAEAAFANAVLLAPQLSLARYQLGLLQFSSGRAAVGLLSWSPLLELPATDPLPHFVRGFAALAQDRFDEALDHYHRGLALNTANPPLSGDIEKVIAGIRARTAPSHDAGGTTLSEAQTHLLLANYQQQGRAH